MTFMTSEELDALYEASKRDIAHDQCPSRSATNSLPL
jgi:hypothetical protein